LVTWGHGRDMSWSRGKGIGEEKLFKDSTKKEWGRVRTSDVEKHNGGGIEERGKAGSYLHHINRWARLVSKKFQDHGRERWTKKWKRQPAGRSGT